MRVKIFQEADKKQMRIDKLCKKYGVSRSWFYKWKERRDNNKTTDASYRFCREPSG